MRAVSTNDGRGPWDRARPPAGRRDLTGRSARRAVAVRRRDEVRLGTPGCLGHHECGTAGRGLEDLDRGHAGTGRDKPGTPIPGIDEVRDVYARPQVLTPAGSAALEPNELERGGLAGTQRQARLLEDLAPGVHERE